MLECYQTEVETSVTSATAPPQLERSSEPGPPEQINAEEVKPKKWVDVSIWLASLFLVLVLSFILFNVRTILSVCDGYLNSSSHIL